jgi:hypothetical protein
VGEHIGREPVDPAEFHPRSVPPRRASSGAPDLPATSPPDAGAPRQQLRPAVRVRIP